MPPSVCWRFPHARNRRAPRKTKADEGAAPGRPRSALIVVDVQNCILPKGGGNTDEGSLAVGKGNAIIPAINALIRSGRYDFVVATQDWHPAGHVSFASTHNRPAFTKIQLAGKEQMLWPDHCVQGTYCAQLATDLDATKIAYVQQKGDDPNVDSYSGFYDNQKLKHTHLDAWLKEHGVQEVAVVGIATDYCVAATAQDAAELGYKTSLVLDATAGVDNPSGSLMKRVEEIRTRGGTVVESAEALKAPR